MPQCPEEATIEDQTQVHLFAMQCRKHEGHEGYHWYSPSDDGESWQMFWKTQTKTNLTPM
jgi:uncharacterized protein YrzB (UPF0473 family)